MVVKGGGIASRYSEGLGVLANDDGALESGNLAGSKAWGLDSGRVQGWWGKGDRRSNYNYFCCFQMFCCILYISVPP